MISLIFIPILFWVYSKPSLDKLNQRVLDLGLPYKAKKGEKAPEYAVIPIDGFNYTIINLPTNFDENTENEYFKQIKKLQQENVDKTGIKFQLTERNNYNDLVRLINLMLKAKQEMYGLDTENNNAFYVVHRKFDYADANNIVLCGGVIFDYTDQKDYDMKHFNLLKKIKKYSPKEVYYLIIGFFILSYFSIQRLIKFNK